MAATLRTPGPLTRAGLPTRLPPAPLPDAPQPMMATLVNQPFDGPDWAFEPKFDGLRVLGRFDGRELLLLSRNGQAQNFQFPDVAEALPERATVEVRKAKRAGRVYVDVLQNARGHHAVPPYVLRAVPGATVSMPLAWSEVTGRLDSGRFELRAALRRLARQKRDPLAALLP
jgi:bifunctional non-homologous end joining protein LigD